MEGIRFLNEVAIFRSLPVEGQFCESLFVYRSRQGVQLEQRVETEDIPMQLRYNRGESESQLPLAAPDAERLSE